MLALLLGSPPAHDCGGDAATLHNRPLSIPMTTEGVFLVMPRWSSPPRHRPSLLRRPGCALFSLSALLVSVWALWAVPSPSALGRCRWCDLPGLRARPRPSTDRNGTPHWPGPLGAAGLRHPVAMRESPRGDLLATWGGPAPRIPAPALRGARLAPLAHRRRAGRRTLPTCAGTTGPGRCTPPSSAPLFWWVESPCVGGVPPTRHRERARVPMDAVLAQGIAAHAYAGHLVAIARAFVTWQKTSSRCR